MIYVEITNFQSISHISLEIEGFTTLIGRNFLGKSATLRAINAALTNQQGTDFIRWGEKYCEVKIKTKDLEILWHKEKGNNYYKVKNKDTEEVFSKIGAQPPPKPILDAGFGVIEIANEKINLLYSEQFFPLFLIDRKDTKSADLLISIYGLDRLYKAVDLCEKDRRKSRDLLKLRKGDREIAKTSLQRFKDFEKVSNKVEEISKIKNKIEKEEKELDFLKDITNKTIECTLSIKKLIPLKSIPVPDYDSIQKDILENEKAKKYLSELRNIKNSIINLQKSKEILIPESVELKEQIKVYKNINNLENRYNSLSTDIKKLKSLHEIKIPEPEIDIKEYQKLNELYVNLKIKSEEIKKIRSDKVELDSLLESTELELQKYDICPACGAELKK